MYGGSCRDRNNIIIMSGPSLIFGASRGGVWGGRG